MKDEQSHTRGLVAVEESRLRRKLGSFPQIPPRFLLWTVTVLIAWGIFYWRKNESEIESQKAALFARQRGVAAELGPRIDVQRKRIEDWVVAAAGPYAGDLVSPELASLDFRTLPGVYLRLRMTDAASVESIRKMAGASLRDAFTACLFREPNIDPTTGPACKASHDCAPGTFCNEVDHCMAPAQPYNLRSTYFGTRILGEEWSVRLRTAESDMKMRLLEREFDSAVKDDIPLVIDLLTRAQFFLLVLDEEAPGVTIPPGKVPLDVIQASPHPARVFLYGLRPGMDHPLLRLRREVNARFMATGENMASDDVRDAQQRQVNSCQLALAVNEALAPARAH